MDPESKDIQVRKSLRYSIFDGAFSASMIGLGESYFVAFAVFLKATNIQLGMLSTLPQFIGSILQLLSTRLIVLFGSRKRLVCTAVLLQALIFIPIVLSYFGGSQSVILLMLFVGLYWVFGMLLGPAWNSWMGDLTENRNRGEYFGTRSKVIALSSFIAFFISGSILDIFKRGSMGMFGGFATIFTLALVARLVSFVFLSRKYEPEYHGISEPEFGFRDFLRQERFSGFRVFAYYYGFMNFAVYLAVPFFVPYMLKDLRMSYLTFTAVQAIAVAVKFLAMPVWGRVADQFGARKVIAITGYMMPAVPILWALAPGVSYLILVEMYSGFVWAGLELSMFKFAFDTTSARTRARCMAYSTLINGFLIFAGAVAGSFIVKYNEVFWSKYLLVFVVSGAMRYIVSFSFIGRIKEVMTVEEIPYRKLFFKVISMLPGVGFMYGMIPFKRKKNT